MNSAIDVRQRRQSILIGTFLSLMFIGGCEPWPPDADGMSVYFADNVSSFERLRNEFSHSGYVSISHGFKRGVVFARTADGSREVDLNDARGKQFRELLEAVQSSRIYGNIANGDAVMVQPLGYVTGSSPRYSRYYVFSVTDLDVPLCNEAQSGSVEGECILPLSGGWSLFYRWSTVE